MIENVAPTEQQIPQQPTQQFVPQEYQPQPEVTLFEWQAPNRPFKKRKKNYYMTIAAIVFLIALILFFAGQFLPIAVVFAVAFLFYVLSAVPAETITNRITTYGIWADKSLFYWQEMGRFWYADKYGQRLLHVEIGRFPNRLTLLLGDQKEADLTGLLSQLLLQETPPPTAFDKAAAWLEKKIPLDTDAE